MAPVKFLYFFLRHEEFTPVAVAAIPVDWHGKHNKYKGVHVVRLSAQREH